MLHCPNETPGAVIPLRDGNTPEVDILYTGILRNGMEDLTMQIRAVFDKPFWIPL